MDSYDTETDGDHLTVPTKSVEQGASLDDRLTDNVRQRIGPARYFLSEDGEPIEDWGDVFHRVATNVATAELVHLGNAPEDITEHTASSVDYDEIAENLDPDVREEVQAVRHEFETAMREQRWLPNSPTLMNAGADLQQLSACFVNSPTDSMEDIFQTAKEWGIVEKSGGGMGGAFHHLRPKGARVESTGGVSSGPVSFLTLFDDVAGTVKQGGTRRGAQMAVMHCQHPDVGRFAVSKRGEDTLTNFNISLGISDEFIEAVKADAELTLYDPETGWDDPDPFEVVPESVHFYNPEFEDAWNDELDKPGMGLEGKTVASNFWRDHLENMQNPEAFEAYRDRIDLAPGESMTLPAGFVFQLLVDGAHNNGEPGIFHLDETRQEHSFDVEEHPEYDIHGTNPCAEQPLCEYEACNLGHVNLSLMAAEDAPTWDTYVRPKSRRQDLDTMAQNYLDRALDRDTFQQTIATGVRFLDNVVTMSDFPLEDIEHRVRHMRKIGLGVMGYHQLLIQLGVEYGSRESYAIGRELMRRLDQHATEVSHELAQQRGVFPAWHDSKWARPTAYPEWFRSHAHEDPDDWRRGYSVRNHNQTTVAPTGTTSMIGDTTGGIEPIYQVCFFKNVGDDIQGDDMLVEFDDFFLRTLEANDIDSEAVKSEAEELMRANEFDEIGDLDRVPDDLADLFVTTQDLTVEQHIETQAAFQEYCDSGISKTLNCANDTTLEEVGDAIMLALESGIKGTTVYRDGSRNEQVKTTRVDNNLEPADLTAADDETLIETATERALEDEGFRRDLLHQLERVPLQSIKTTIDEEITVGGIDDD